MISAKQRFSSANFQQALNVGLVSNIIHIWLRAWAFAFAVAFPAITIISPLVHKLVSLVLKEEKHGD